MLENMSWRKSSEPKCTTDCVCLQKLYKLSDVPIEICLKNTQNLSMYHQSISKMGLLKFLLINLFKASESRVVVTEVIMATVQLEDLMFFEEYLLTAFMLVM